MTKAMGRLRKKTGCLNCRQRRKACDERRPTCDRCALSGRLCEWPHSAQMVDRRYAAHPKSRYASINSTSLVCQRSGDAVQKQLTIDLEVIISRHFIEKYYEFLLLPNCHPAFHDGWIRDIQEIMIEDQSLRYAVLANAASHIYNMDTNPTIQSLALRYYSKSIKGLSKALVRANDPYLARCNGLLMSVMLLYLHGCMGNGTYLDIPPHLHAAMRVLTLRFFEMPPATLQPFDILALESVLYQIFLTSTVLWTEEKPLIDFDLAFWLQAESFLEEAVMFPGKPNSLNSPVLGVPAALFRLAIQAQQIYQNSNSYDTRSVDNVRREVETWEGIVLSNRMIETCNDESSRSRQQAYYEGASYLYVLNTSLILDQVKNYGCDARKRERSNRVPEPVPRDTWQIKKALRIIRSFKDNNGWYSCYIGNWPVYTLGFFLSDAEDIELIRNEMNRRWTSTSFMQIYRFHDDLEATWSAREFNAF